MINSNLIHVLKEFDDCYPSMYGYPNINYIYLPLAVILKNDYSPEQVKKHLLDHAGQNGIYNVIRAYLTIGYTDDARILVNFLMDFCSMLTSDLIFSYKFENILEDETMVLE